MHLIPVSGIHFLHAKTTRALSKLVNHPRRGWSLWMEILTVMVSRVDLSESPAWGDSIALKVPWWLMTLYQSWQQQTSKRWVWLWQQRMLSGRQFYWSSGATSSETFQSPIFQWRVFGAARFASVGHAFKKLKIDDGIGGLYRVFLTRTIQKLTLD